MTTTYEEDRLRKQRTVCAPIHIALLLNVHAMPKEIWPHNNSPAGRFALTSLKQWGMIEPNEHGFFSLTDRGLGWLNSMCQVPVPSAREALERGEG